ncbi:MAG: 2-acyl-glycerophospho-ethanolamine acyltransferase [Verrucomicrobiales bacterium]|nr:2-acyl-glycerophospho-ethanolamine acyltransferase [Verrucomicrobiales bacterium]
MASLHDKLEVYGESNIPSGGVLVIANRLSFQDLLHLEKKLIGRRLVYLIERGLDYDPLLQAHLEKEDTEALEFSSEEGAKDVFKKELHQCLADDAVAIFIPGLAHTRSGQVVEVPSEILKFLTSAGAPVLPLFVDHPEESALSVENRTDVERIVLSFGEPLRREASNLANFTENLLIASEAAYENRPLFRSNLAYEILKGLKRHGKSAQIIDGLDHSDLRFDKLLAAAIVLAKIIRKETTKPRVGIILPPGKGGFLANAAVLLAGKIPVNLNFTAGEKAIESCIEQAGLDKYITADPFVRKMSSFNWPPNRQLLMIDRILPGVKKRIGLWLVLSKVMSVGMLRAMLKLSKKGGHDEAVLLFTSGSSGDPKGVVLSHRNMLANVNQFGARIDMKSDDKILGCLPLFHSFGCTVTLWYPMIEGVSVVTYPSPLEVGTLAELIEKYSVSLILTTPTFLRGYLRKATKEQLASAKLVITGAEKLPKKVADSFEKRFDKPVLEGYGLTETSPATNVNLPDPEVDPDDRIPVVPNRRFGSVGLLLPGIAVRITDPETHEPLPVHSSGMIWLRGANVFEGYLNQPEKTEAVIKNGWFMTGDIGRLDEDGFLYIEGRLSRFSKIGGEMVPHETVEDVINKALGHTDDERTIAVVGVPDEAKGEALILLSSDPDIDLQELRAKLLEDGIPALWVPKKVVDVEEIPILASGKLDIKGCETLATN